ncbi:MAG TPA: ABC-2 family transporter protein [Caulobacteraceae bacterium]|nr:ABC-2 family transporter protein [Caulobacteraceae bacterium]
MRSTPRSAEPILAAPPRRWAGELAAAASSARIGFAGAFAAWPVLAGRTAFYALIMVVLSALWDKVAAERLPGTLAHTLPAGGLALYVGVTEAIVFSVAFVHLKLEDDIRSGRLEPQLLRPKAYLARTIAEALGASCARFLAMAGAGLALLVVSGRAGPPLAALPGVLALGVLGAAVGVLLLTIVGLCAFWVRRVLPAYLVVQKLIFLLGGLFAPITLYPPWLRAIGEASPFGAHLFYAGEAAIHPSTDIILSGLAAQAAWLALLTLLALAMWRAGLARVLREGV